VAELLFASAEEISEDENLFDAGLDSVALLTLVERWRGQGADVAFVDLAENPTLAGFRRVLSAAAPQPESPDA
jgi:aryl carrier-like protein